jgi:hypothetical protein
MKTLRCFLSTIIVVISTATFVLGGDMQVPGKNDPTPTPTPTALLTASISNGLNQPTSTEESQLIWQDGTTLFVEILLTIF